MPDFSVPLEFRRGQNATKLAQQMDEAASHVDLLAASVGADDLGEIDLLDVGCGTKLTEFFLETDAAIGDYTGVDVYRPIIDFLREEVDDPRFEYHHADLHHEHVNPQGVPLSTESRLPLEGRTFDLISLFSVFTHQTPTDYRSLLGLLRRYAEPGTRLVFYLYINEPTAGGHGLMDRLLKGTRERLGTTEVVASQEGWAAPDFVDAGLRPTQWAVFSRSHALELIDGTGWEVESVNDPTPHIQHWIEARAV